MHNSFVTKKTFCSCLKQTIQNSKGFFVVAIAVLLCSYTLSDRVFGSGVLWVLGWFSRTGTDVVSSWDATRQKITPYQLLFLINNRHWGWANLLCIFLFYHPRGTEPIPRHFNQEHLLCSFESCASKDLINWQHMTRILQRHIYWHFLDMNDRTKQTNLPFECEQTTSQKWSWMMGTINVNSSMQETERTTTVIYM